MRWSLSISSLVHAALLLSAVVALPDPEEYEIKASEAVPVEILSENDIPRPEPQEEPVEKKVEKPTPPKPEKPKEVAKLPPKPEPDPPKQVAALPPEPEPEPVKVKEPPKEKPAEEKAPEPEPEPKLEAKPEKAEKPKKLIAESHPLPKAKPKPPVRKKQEKPERFDDSIDQLLNKLPDETPQPQPEVEEEPEPPTETASATDYFQNGTQFDRDQISEIIFAKMARCWTPPAGLRDARSIKVTFALAFKANGEFARQPENKTPVSDPQTRAAAESARRALIRCAPYILPEETYDVWKEMILNFHPGRMF